MNLPKDVKLFHLENPAKVLIIKKDVKGMKLKFKPKTERSEKVNKGILIGGIIIIIVAAIVKHDAGSYLAFGIWGYLIGNDD